MRTILMGMAFCLIAATEPEVGTENAVVTSAPAPTVLTGEIKPFGEWRFVGNHVQRFPLNAAGTSAPVTWLLDQRLDIGLEQVMEDGLEFTGELELFYGQVAGDLDPIGADLRSDARTTLRGWDLKEAELRQFFIRWQLPWFRLRLGQMASHFGLGLLSNDGRDQPNRFGYPYTSDLSDRVVLATKPFAKLESGGWLSRLAIGLGGGIVYRDENASLRQGDLAGEALAFAQYEDERLRTGVYVVGRFQEDENGADLTVGAFDLFFERTPLAEESGLYLGAEAVLLTGTTTRVLRGENPEGMSILSGGGVARAGWHTGWHALNFQMEGGAASGDGNPYNNRVSIFSFDPAYKVGLVLFDWVLREQSAMSAQQAGDPNRVGEPRPGVTELATAGRVSQAVYLFPTVEVHPLPDLRVLVGYLAAWSPADVLQVYQTFNNGGVPTNAYGTKHAGRFYGQEFDLGVDWEHPIWGQMKLLVGLQAGWFFPGSAFDRPNGQERPSATTRVVSRAALTW